MLSDAHYRARWERKKELYADNGYSVVSESNPDGRLIVTEDNLQTGLDSKAIEELAHKFFVR